MLSILPRRWLPPGKHCAVLFSVDDIHPGTAADGAEAGGALADGVLGVVARLQAAQPRLQTSLCVTPDWRPRAAVPDPDLVARHAAPANRAYLVARHPRGRLALDRHPDFCAYLRGLPRVELVAHGLHHVQRGLPPAVEFARASERRCDAALGRIDAIFRAAGLPTARGFSPPGWEAPAPLRRALRRRGLRFVASARDIVTDITPAASTAMSGMTGMPLIAPGLTGEGLVHIPTNFQATSSDERAFAILEAGGLLSIKAHAITQMGSYRALDGLDDRYAARIAALLDACTARFGDSIWWSSMDALADAALSSGMECDDDRADRR